MIDLEAPVQVYRNLRAKCWSVRQKGKVVAHLEEVTLRDCSFRVQPAGRARALRQKRKNVHAYVHGHFVAEATQDGATRPVGYNPHRAGTFTERATGTAIYNAALVEMRLGGTVFIG